MNPGMDNYEEYVKYRSIFKKIRTLRKLDGLDLNDDKCLEIYKNKKNMNNMDYSNNNSSAKRNLFDFDLNYNNNNKSGDYNKYNGENSKSNENSNYNLSHVSGNYDSNMHEINDNDFSNLIKSKKRQSTITYSQRMLKKADNLTKFNRKNHSEGNKHITNNDL